MRVLITAGPTREPIDSVRFITNASSGQMGLALAEAASQAGCDTTLLLGPVNPQFRTAAAEHAHVVPFTTVEDLRDKLTRLFPRHDALIMAAAVGDFRVEQVSERKIRRVNGPVHLTLVPTEDVLAGVAATKRDDQFIVSFAVEDGSPDESQARARRELAAKNADFVVVNTPDAMSSPRSLACILSADEVLLRWGVRPKKIIAAAIVRLLCKVSQKQRAEKAKPHAG